MKRILWPLCAVAGMGLSVLVGCAGCPDGSDAPSYRSYPRTNPGQTTPGNDPTY